MMGKVMTKEDFDRFIESILHGDVEHRAWLLEAAAKYWESKE